MSKSSKKILVTGGLGVVGVGLAKELKQRGYDVVSCDLRHGEFEKGFGVKTDIDKAFYARCDIGEFRQVERIFAEMKRAIEGAAENGEVTCAALWMIADRLGTKRKEVSAACETLKIKIRECQLGTF